MKTCKEDLGAQAISNILFGLQGADCKQPAVRGVLTVLVPKIVICEERFSEFYINNALIGLRRLSGGGPAVQSLLLALAPNILDCKEALSTRSIANALHVYGRQGNECNVAVLEMLYSQIQNLSAVRFSAVLDVDILFLKETLTLCLPSIRERLLEDCKKWDDVVLVLAAESTKRKRRISL